MFPNPFDIQPQEASVVEKITGQGRTSQFGILGTDMSVFWVSNDGNYVHSAHGDSYSSNMPGGISKTPVSFRTSSLPQHGIKWDNCVGPGNRTARQILDYRRTPNVKREIPCWGMSLPNNDTVLTTFAPSEKFARNGSWETDHVAMWISHDYHAEYYEREPIAIFKNVDNFKFFQNQTAVKFGEEVYVFGTMAGRASHNNAGAGIYLMKHDWKWMNRLNEWQFWVYDPGTKKWGWYTEREPWPILGTKNHDNSREGIGELSAHIIEGKVVLMYVDYTADAVIAQVADRPDGRWSPPQICLTDVKRNKLYAPGIHPWSTLDDLHFGLSVWKDDDDSREYGVYHYRVRLRH